MLRNESSYLLSTESVQWELVSTEAQPGIAALDSSSSTLGAAPSLLAGALPRWLGENTSLAWSFLTRQKFHVRLGQRVTDPIPDPAVRSAAETYFDQRLTESWAGLTLSRRLSDSMGLGLTWYGVYRGQRTRSELSVGLLTLKHGIGSLAESLYEKYSDNIRLSAAVKRIVIEGGAVKGLRPRMASWRRTRWSATTATKALDLMPGLPDSMRMPIEKVTYSACCHVMFALEHHLLPEGWWALAPPRVEGTSLAGFTDDCVKSPFYTPRAAVWCTASLTARTLVSSTG